ncbi:phosphotransferase enzyme family protein [Nannizzia gypsea CBS 118893]|uniref:Phosphotransferase enzyme family protein n=1 Tax=Arthroderma gypseum (strain ATCC MYA-4604 / CBS 118893) TaxID=535722 RepID=E5R302_ARTGP|nr:phosphotransferase enzyme family protein [Nannizzia gypsea CBS 118893]EFQ98706.1 phosphotransferase enzyme family protein [Nannizzia gypsea CBS 118893]
MQRAYYGGPILQITAEDLDGTIFVAKYISEEELFEYTRNRWIYNETLQLSIRYLKLDLRQLLEAAVKAVSSNDPYSFWNPHLFVSRSQSFQCREGLSNKVLILTMDNDMEVVAKLPNPIAGPGYYTTASEVATREFLRDVLDIPTPSIIAWSADRSNPVGAEYILEEKVPGTPLGQLWYRWPMKSRRNMIEQIIQIERRLASATFSSIGCIYFKDSLPENALSGSIISSTLSLRPSAADRFTLGLLVSNDLWRGERANMSMNRGPFRGPLDFVEAMAKNEFLYTKEYARPYMNYHRSSTEAQLPDKFLRLLRQYLDLSPDMVPLKGAEDTHSPTLWHPDLHLDNVFVDPETHNISQIIDWQSAAVMPLYYQRAIPRMFEHPSGVPCGWTMALPENYNDLDQDEKDKFESDRKSIACQKYYEVETRVHNPRHVAAFQLQDLDVRIDPSRIVVGAWEGEAIFFLRRAIYRIVDQWESLCPGLGPCPIGIKAKDLELHASEEEISSSVAEILTLFRDAWGLPPDGMVHPADFERVKAAVAEQRDAFFESADNETDKELYKRIWPCQGKQK